MGKEKERIQLGIITQAEMRNKAKEELENLRNELHHEEHEAEAKRREALKQRKILEDREEMKRACELQVQMHEHKRRMKVEAHKRAAQQQLLDRRKAFDDA